MSHISPIMAVNKWAISIYVTNGLKQNFLLRMPQLMNATKEEQIQLLKKKNNTEKKKGENKDQQVYLSVHCVNINMALLTQQMGDQTFCKFLQKF